MATGDEESRLDEIIAKYTSVSRDHAIAMEGMTEKFRKLGLEGLDLKKKLASIAEGVERARKRFTKTVDEISDDIDDLGEEFKEGKITAEDLRDELRSLRNQVNNTANATEKATLIQKKAYLEEASARVIASELMQSSMGEVSGVVVLGLGKAFKDLTIKALASGSALEMTAAVIKASFDIGHEASKVGTKNLIEFGKQTASAGGSLGKFGKNMTMVGEVGGQLISVFTELAKAGIDFLVKSAQTFTQDFRSMSATGASFAGGMEEMIKVSTDAGLTTSQFAKVMSESKDAFLLAGLTVGEGAKKLATGMNAASKMIGKSGNSLSDEMAALGISYEDQSSIMATFMAQQKIAGKNIANIAPAELAEGTRKYAENLKIISDITGKDAKKLQEKAQAETMRMQMMGALKDPKQQAAFQQAHSTLNALPPEMAAKMQTALMQKIEGNVVTDPSIAANQDLMAAVERMAKEVKSGNTDMKRETVATLQAARQGQLSRGSSGVGGATAQAQLLGNVGGVAGDISNMAAGLNAFQTTVETVDESAKNAKSQGEAKKSTAAELASAERDMAMMTQNIAGKHLPELAGAVKATTEKIKSYLEMGINASAASVHMPIWVAPVLGILTTIATNILLLRVGGGTAGKVADIATSGAGKVSDGLGKGMEGVGAGADKLGKGIGRGLQGALRGLALGLASFAAPPVMLGMAVAAAGVLAMATAFRIAGPAMEPFGNMLKTVFEGIGSVIESIGNAASTVISGIADSLTELSTGADPMKLFLLAPAIGAIGFSLMPFAVGGALAGLVAGVGGFKSITDGLRDFESLDPAKLTSIAEAMTKVTAALPNPLQLAAMAASGIIGKITGATSTLSSSTTAAEVTTGTDSKGNQQLLIEVKKMTELLIKQNKLAEEAMNLRRQLVDVSESHKRTSDRIFTATA